MHTFNSNSTMRNWKTNSGDPMIWKCFIQNCRAFTTVSNLTRNVAIIAHVDHGKTTLIDCLLRQCGTIGKSSQSRLLDSNHLEKERGITILSKSTCLAYKNFRINVIDTPGHADFGGEVERALSLVDGVILVVDASEGPMAQTKFVLAKALKRQLQPIVVFNKVDRPTSRCDEVDSELFDLFSALDASDSQLNYPVVYASAKEGWASTQIPCEFPITGSMEPLLDLLIDKVPPPKVSLDKPFSMLVNSIEVNPYIGRCYLGRVESGRISIGDKIQNLSPDSGVVEEGKVSKIFFRRGLEQADLTHAVAGDIVCIAGVSRSKPNYTICSPDVCTPLPVIHIDPPTVSMFFQVNNSPLAGIDGKTMTSQTLFDRLYSESENNLSILIKKTDNPDVLEVAGRGEMQLGILLEGIRREGYELAVSPPRVVFRRNSKGEVEEPYEEITVDCNTEYTGTVIEKMSKRRGNLIKMSENDSKTRLVFNCPMRGLIGFSSEFRNDTQGTGVLNHSFTGYHFYSGPLETSRKGSLISMADGRVTAYALSELESRGSFFVEPGCKVYSGMIVGESSRELDLEINPCKAKILTNMRSSVKEEFYRLPSPRILNLEEAIAYVADDEIIEITPKNIRLRKSELDLNKRKVKSKKVQLNSWSF